MRGGEDWLAAWRSLGARERLAVRRANQRGEALEDPELAAVAVGSVVRARERAAVSPETQRKLWIVAGVALVLAGVAVQVQAVVTGVDVLALVLAGGFVALGLVYLLFLTGSGERAERSVAANRTVAERDSP